MKTALKKAATTAQKIKSQKASASKSTKPKKGSWEAILKSMEYAKKHPIEFVL